MSAQRSSSIARFSRKAAVSASLAALLVGLATAGPSRGYGAETGAGPEIPLNTGTTLSTDLNARTAPGAVLNAGVAPDGAPGEGGLDLGSVFDIVGAISTGITALYYGFDSSYIDKYYGGSVGGYLLHMLLTGGDTTGPELDYIVEQLKKMSETLDHLVKMDIEIEDQLNQLANEVNIDTAEINKDGVLTNMNDALGSLEAYVGGSKTPTNYWLSTFTATSTPLAKDSPEIAAINTTCANDIMGAGKPGEGNLQSWLQTIDSNMQGSNGFIQLAAQQIQAIIEGGGDAYTEYQVLEAWVMRYIFVQYKGLNLYVECAHALNYTEEEIATQYNKYLLSIVEQLETFRNAVETVVIGTNYELARDGFSTTNGSSALIALINGSMSPGALSVFRVDFLIDQLLGTTDLASLSKALDDNSAVALRAPAGALSGRALSAQNENMGGFQLSFAPFIENCPTGFEHAATWQIANGGTDTLNIEELHAWVGHGEGCLNDGYACFVPRPNGQSYYGSDLYQISAAPLTLRPNETGYVGLCNTKPNVAQPDTGLILDYSLTPANSIVPGPSQSIFWAGDGKITAVNDPNPPFLVNSAANTITIGSKEECTACSPSFGSAGTGTASALTGLPFMTWDGTTLTGNSSDYRMIRYSFPDVSPGTYQVNGPTGANLLSPHNMSVALYDRRFNQFFSGGATDGDVLAGSQVRSDWETFVLKDYDPSGADGAAQGQFRAANGDYVVVSSGQLVANADTGQDVTFVGWTAGDMASDIVNWGYLEFDGAGYVSVDPSTQQITMVTTTADATKFRITFVDKGADALVTGQSYSINLAYALADDEATSSCGQIGPQPPGTAATCSTYYLYANVGYPYGYLGYSPMIVAGGYGKSLAVTGGGPADWQFEKTTTTGTCTDHDRNAAIPSAAASEGSGVEVKLDTKGVGNYYCIVSESLGYFRTTLNLSDQACTYNFSLKMYAATNFAFDWDAANHHSLKIGEAFIHFYRQKTSGDEIYVATAVAKANRSADNPYTTENFSYYANADDFDENNTAYIGYGAQLEFNAEYPFTIKPTYPPLPNFAIEVESPTVEFYLTSIGQNKYGQGTCGAVAAAAAD